MTDKQFTHLLVLSLAFQVFFGCNRTSKQDVSSQPPAAATAVPSGSSTILGRVTFAGTVPVEGKNPAAAFPECRADKNSDLNKSYQIQNGRVANVFVYLKEGVSGTFPTPPQTAVLDQKTCVYVPRVMGLQVNQKVTILNSDPFLHNVHSMNKNSAAFNVGMPVMGQKIDKSFSSAEIMVPVRCDVHGWMRAYIGVLPHPFFAVTGADGIFTIPGVPPGTYTIEAWHEKLGTKTQEIKVAAQGSAEILFSF